MSATASRLLIFLSCMIIAGCDATPKMIELPDGWKGEGLGGSLPAVGQRVTHYDWTEKPTKYLLVEVLKAEPFSDVTVRVLGMPNEPPRTYGISYFQGVHQQRSINSLPADQIEQVEVETNLGWMYGTVLGRKPGRLQVHINGYPDQHNAWVLEEHTRPIKLQPQ